MTYGQHQKLKQKNKKKTNIIVFKDNKYHFYVLYQQAAWFLPCWHSSQICWSSFPYIPEMASANPAPVCCSPQQVWMKRRWTHQKMIFFVCLSPLSNHNQQRRNKITHQGFREWHPHRYEEERYGRGTALMWQEGNHNQMNVILSALIKPAGIYNNADILHL